MIINLLGSASGISLIMLAVAILSILVNIVMIFAYISSKNAIIDIVTSFETQNSNSYEIRINVFNRAIAFLFNIESNEVDEDTKRRQLGEIFDNLLICATRQDTLSSFEKVIETYFGDGEAKGYLDIKYFRKFKACVRKEFGCKKYDSKVVGNYAIPNGMLTINNYKNQGVNGEGMPNKPTGTKVNSTNKVVQQNNAPTTGVTIVTAKSENQEEKVTQPTTPVTPKPVQTPPTITSIFATDKPANPTMTSIFANNDKLIQPQPTQPQKVNPTNEGVKPVVPGVAPAGVKPVGPNPTNINPQNVENNKDNFILPKDFMPKVKTDPNNNNTDKE